MKTKDLIQGDAELWHAATHHAFLDEVRNGTLAPSAFTRWLSQDYHFAMALTRTQARTLASAPREDLELLAGPSRGGVVVPAGALRKTPTRTWCGFPA
jgi:thiaminase/transcriptional activator TenA